LGVFLPTEKENHMQILCDSPAIQEALNTQVETTRLITGYVERLSNYEGGELGQLVQFIVMASSDTLIELEAALGFSVRINRFDGCRYGDADFLPCWEVSPKASGKRKHPEGLVDYFGAQPLQSLRPHHSQ
jgi:hypothetical protein